MNDEEIQNLKKNIVSIGRLLWEKDLVSGLNGNISRRVDEETILLTGHGTCLGLLQQKDILLVGLDGTLKEEGHISTEKLLHTEVYKNFPDAQAVVHTHPTYTNAFFLENEVLSPRILEAKCFLGDVKSILQTTPAVTDATPVMEALKNNNITVLRNHGVVTKGIDLFDCFLLVQALEEACKIDAISRLYVGTGSKSIRVDGTVRTGLEPVPTELKKYKLFSKKQIDEIVVLVNADTQLNEMGAKTNMTMDLAVKLDETGEIFSFNFEKGKIVNVGNSEDVEFLISASQEVWRAVFNQEIDPFVATTQKKMNLRGDFAKISQWYAPCSRLFELWAQVPVE
ncbi:hypothetical protein MNBD_UNCLBAC01-694 [hydrothermal vent metagenome]|uniref:Class II aldolase/adducin N-terminal domain-containing protein n=1 Tax=hydrothermal vent metagenome TaxID=652676 RepID=A0A3B1DDM4_9ZZZZ